MIEPNFIIAGERRSGTTTLGKWIQCHPEIFINQQFDQAYFMDDEIRGTIEWSEGFGNKELWYSKHSKEQYCEQFIEADKSKHKAIGEKSADYLFLNESLERMHNYYPNAKIILTLRNPIKRSWSHYWNEVGKGRESLTFEEAIKKEDERISSSDFARTHLSYLNRGKYINSIKNLLKLYPENQIHIIILEEAIKQPVEVLKSLYNFLEVNPEIGLENAGKRFNNNWTTIPKKFWLSKPILRKIEEKIINRGVKLIAKGLYHDFYTRRKKLVKLQAPFRVSPAELKMEDSLKNELIEYFTPSINELEALLDKNLSFWKK